ncbi:MAG: ATP-binding cassette domain-containing protein [Bifidobacteriaceae bacterium]|nr:ATP-binding cassette domain-containing protein [Bifidobacteriaceae bacterium]
MSTIELRDIHVTFHEGGKTVEAVKGVNLLALDGEIFGIVGYSGAGKSTLVRTINLLERPTQGQVIIDGEDVTQVRGAKLRELRRTIGFVFQGFNLVGNLTVAQNIQFALKAGGWKRDQWRDRTLELLRLVGLEDRADSYPSGLSGGQKQRVAIARALANNPKILLCDEATSALDLETTEDILALLKRINRELKITIVFITHQLEVAKQVFDHVAVMEQGRIVEQGETFDVFSAPKHPTTKSLVGRFLGISLPSQLIASLPAGELVQLTYRGDDALEPLISDVAIKRGVSINVLHGNVEYFGTRPIGVLIVLISGDAGAVTAALADLKSKVLEFHVLDRAKIAAGATTTEAFADADGADNAGGAVAGHATADRIEAQQAQEEAR